MAKSTAAKSTKTAKKEPAAKPAAAPKAAAAKAPAKAKATKPAAAPVAAAKPAAPAPMVKPTVKSAPSSKVISQQERYHMIDEAAYYRAEKNGFQVDPHANWVAAEQEIDELLAKQNIKVG
jgi:hypothetical protein